ncbi:hypothetical protein L596_013080 [Steinernema carpocapsae]|uniref:G-protein coupled receptors family 1 profile domain-containing protein n=1 Tax=Steinernema carpocapsae TaxID=34508 RepID=A0A4U5NZ58_STECR|nr:hypothetical protein L596_013080 [Steinernema carpocapsae]
MGIYYSVFLIVIDFIGLFGNVAFVLLTVLFKQFRKSRCAFLMGIVSFCDVFMEVFIIIISIMSLSGQEFSQHACFHTLSLPIFLNCVEAGLMLSISFDRLTAIALPMWYQQDVHPKLFLFLSFVPGMFFGSIVIYTGVYYLEPDAMLPLCNVPASMNSITYTLWNKISLGINASLIIVYVLACLILWRKARETSSNYIKTQITVMKTIICIVAFYIITCVLPDLLINRV